MFRASSKLEGYYFRRDFGKNLLILRKIKMRKYLPELVIIILILLAFYSINAFFNSFSNNIGSPWCFNIVAFYNNYKFFFRNGKSKVYAIAWMTIVGIGFYFLKEDYMGEDGMLSFYILSGVNLLGILLPASFKQLPPK